MRAGRQPGHRADARRQRHHRSLGRSAGGSGLFRRNDPVRRHQPQSDPARQVRLRRVRPLRAAGRVPAARRHPREAGGIRHQRDWPAGALSHAFRFQRPASADGLQAVDLDRHAASDRVGHHNVGRGLRQRGAVQLLQRHGPPAAHRGHRPDAPGQWRAQGHQRQHHRERRIRGEPGGRVDDAADEPDLRGLPARCGRAGQGGADGVAGRACAAAADPGQPSVAGMRQPGDDRDRAAPGRRHWPGAGRARG
ncbi:hypothetical protein G6F57_017910 [Rhizopus arrhizus]|nr:hypothetical protein G6F57_017910 [Rhizopus arrhizus]